MCRLFFFIFFFEFFFWFSISTFFVVCISTFSRFLFPLFLWSVFPLFRVSVSTFYLPKSTQMSGSWGDRGCATCQICVIWIVLLGMGAGIPYTILNDAIPATVYQCRLENFTLQSTMTVGNVTITHNYFLINNETWQNTTSNFQGTDMVWHLYQMWNMNDECDFTSSGDYDEPPLVQEIGTERECYYEDQDECQVTFTEPQRVSLTAAIVFATLLALVGLVGIILMTIIYVKGYRDGEFPCGQ